MSLLGQIKIGIILLGPLFDLFYDRSLVEATNASAFSIFWSIDNALLLMILIHSFGFVSLLFPVLLLANQS